MQDEICFVLSDTSLEDFPLPNVSQFTDVTLPPASQRRVKQVNSDTVLPRNQLYYQYAEHHKAPQSPYVDRSDITRTLHAN